MVDWRKKFDRFGDQSICMHCYDITDYISLEEMYQLFKARYEAEKQMDLEDSEEP